MGSGRARRQMPGGNSSVPTLVNMYCLSLSLSLSLSLARARALAEYALQKHRLVQLCVHAAQADLVVAGAL